jgi:hypothetical protein
MRVYVLGAGASLHVGYPLTRDLGPRLLKWIGQNPGPENYPFWPDPQELLKLGSIDDIEDFVTKLEDSPKPGYMLAGLREALCNYFDSIRCGPAALYECLAREVVQEGDALVTFNYDVSLERELKRAGKWEIANGYGFDLGIGEMRTSPNKVLKLHGSTNWMDSLFGGVRGGMTSGFGFESHGVRPVILPQEFDFLGYRAVRDPQFNGGGAGRAGSMVLPTLNKQFYVSTSSNPREREAFWSSLWNQAAEAVRRADNIVIIGYSLPAADARARDLLLREGNRDADVTLCCGGQTKRLGEEFVSAGFRRGRINASETRFEDFLAGG